MFLNYNKAFTHSNSKVLQHYMSNAMKEYTGQQSFDYELEDKKYMNLDTFFLVSFM